MKDRLLTVGIGLAFGFALHRVGFSSWDEVHKMFTFADLRLTLGFAAAIAILFVAWRVIQAVSASRWSPRALHPGVVPGALLFGAGWAISGACPSIALVQLGEGKLLAACTLVGIFAGNALYPVVHRRFFRWTSGSCLDE